MRLSISNPVATNNSTSDTTVNGGASFRTLSDDPLLPVGIFLGKLACLMLKMHKLVDRARQLSDIAWY